MLNAADTNPSGALNLIMHVLFPTHATSATSGIGENPLYHTAHAVYSANSRQRSADCVDEQLCVGPFV